MLLFRFNNCANLWITFVFTPLDILLFQRIVF